MSHIPFENDLLQRKAFADKLLTFLTTERHFVEGALVVTLQAPFGSGKTFFLQNWKKCLQVPGKENPRPIMLNAWESDYCNDPLLALISAIYKELENDEDKKKILKTIVEAMKDIGWFGIGMANSFLAHKLGFNSVEAGQLAEGKKEQRKKQNNPIPNILEIFNQKQEALTTIKNSLKTLFEGDAVKVIIMVDELDRCRPDYAISYLETIKHIFDIPGLVFVLAVDHAQLQATAKSLFGDEMNFDEYLRKFVQRRIDLPDIDESACGKVVEFYYNKYINTSSRFTKCPADFLAHIQELFKITKPNFRQSQEIFRIIGHLFSTNQEDTRTMHWCWTATMVLLSVIYVMRPSFFKSIGKSILDLQVAASELNKVLKGVDENKRIWWLHIFALGYFSDSTDQEHDSKIIFDTLKQLNCIELELTLEEWEKDFLNYHLTRSPNFTYVKGRIARTSTYIREVVSFGNM